MAQKRPEKRRKMTKKKTNTLRMCYWLMLLLVSSTEKPLPPHHLFRSQFSGPWSVVKLPWFQALKQIQRLQFGAAAPKGGQVAEGP